MGLLSIFKRRADASTGAAASAPDPSDVVQRARTRARQRLIGAIVLLGVGIIGFPLVFETQPRPIPVNIPIETPPKDGAPALTMPAARPPAATPSTASAPAVAMVKPEPAVPAEVITETREEAGREVGASPASAPAVRPAAEPIVPKPASRPAVVVPAVVPAVKPPVDPKAAAPAEGLRAQALLEGKRDKPADAGRFVVQVGAFADAAAAHETRLKAERLGMKTYTQVAATASGNRIRVRLGPFASRADADKALSKARGAGMTAVVLTL